LNDGKKYMPKLEGLLCILQQNKNKCTGNIRMRASAKITWLLLKEMEHKVVPDQFSSM